MGFFSHLKRSPAPTSIDDVEGQNRGFTEEDLEKASENHKEQETTDRPHHHDPIAEKAVSRFPSCCWPGILIANRLFGN